MNREEKNHIQWECQQLLNLVMTLTDNCSWRELAACYTDAASLFRPSAPNTAIEGREAIYNSFLGREPRVTCHSLTNCVFEVVSATKVRATSRVLLIAGEATEKLPALADSKIMVGSFIDDLVLQDHQWLIEKRKGGVELKYQP